MNPLDLPRYTLPLKFGSPVFSDTDPLTITVPEVRCRLRQGAEVVLRASIRMGEDGVWVSHTALCADESPFAPLVGTNQIDEESPIAEALSLFQWHRQLRYRSERPGASSGFSARFTDDDEGGGLLLPVRR